MDSAVMTGVISGAVTLIVCLINNYFQRQENDRKHASTIDLITYRMDQLEKAVSKHNEMIDRMYKVEKRLDVAEHRIDEIEKGVGE